MSSVVRGDLRLIVTVLLYLCRDDNSASRHLIMCAPNKHRTAVKLFFFDPNYAMMGIAGTGVSWLVNLKMQR